ncbi:LamG domain-containing protein [Candidatus Calescamantes bacterium]|nr:LamG domain-containing protein [Candidatus Calescamantes bacterium]
MIFRIKLILMGLAMSLFTLLFGAQGEEIKGTMREKLLADKSLLFFVPFDFSVDAEKAYHHKEGKLIGEGEYIPGVVGNCLSLPAEGKGFVYYDIRDNIDFKKGTVMFWFKPYWWGDSKEWKRYTILWVRMEHGKFFYFHRSFRQDHPTHVYIAKSDHKGVSFPTDNYFKKDKWVHIAMTWDVGTKKFIVRIDYDKTVRCRDKGDWEGEGFIPVQLQLGKFYETDDPINAAYDEFYIFNRVLSDEEISQYYQETKPAE